MQTTQAATDVHTILLATDFTPAAQLAGDYAARLAQNLGASVEIAHALAPPNDERDDDSWNAERERREQRLLRQSRELEQKGVHAHRAICTECPAPLAISLMQRRTGADLVVLGTESKSSLDRLLLGSTAEALIRQGTVPVLTVGPRARPPHPDGVVFSRVVLATDFSSASDHAEALALSLAAQLGATLYTFHLHRSGSTEELSSRFNAEMHFRNRLMQNLPPDRYRFFNAEDREGNANIGDMIVQYATEVHADLIVMGARERSFWLLHVRRGVTQDVLAAAECPVLTAR